MRLPNMDAPAMCSLAMLVMVASVTQACSASRLPTSSTPSTPSRITETISASPRLQPEGGMGYGSRSLFPTVTVNNTGLVDATARFTPTASCPFVFCVCRADTTCGTCDLLAGPGVGPTLTVRGILAATSYNLLISARSGGRPLCTTIPAGGVPFSYTVTITHP
jgi:hypothetical protein